MVSPARHHKSTPATQLRAIGAVVARFVHTEEVTGSNPVSPTRRTRSSEREPRVIRVPALLGSALRGGSGADGRVALPVGGGVVGYDRGCGAGGCEECA